MFPASAQVPSPGPHNSCPSGRAALGKGAQPGTRSANETLVTACPPGQVAGGMQAPWALGHPWWYWRLGREVVSRAMESFLKVPAPMQQKQIRVGVSPRRGAGVGECATGDPGRGHQCSLGVQPEPLDPRRGCGGGTPWANPQHGTAQRAAAWADGRGGVFRRASGAIKR